MHALGRAKWRVAGKPVRTLQQKARSGRNGAQAGQKGTILKTMEEVDQTGLWVRKKEGSGEESPL
jgi:hypothetical protein